MSVMKRALRASLKTVGAAAGLILLFDNRAGDINGMLMLGSFVTLGICVLLWWKFDLGEDDWFSPKERDE
jgi:hypothetical protein